MNCGTKLDLSKINNSCRELIKEPRNYTYNPKTKEVFDENRNLIGYGNLDLKNGSVVITNRPNNPLQKDQTQ